MTKTNAFRTIKTAMIMALSVVFVACAQNGGGGSTAKPPTNPGTGPLGTNIEARNCEVGQIFVQQYGCLNRYSCDAGHGWIANDFRCVPGILVTEELKYGTSYGARFFGGLQVTNSSQFALMMKYAGLCDPYWVGWNFGTAKCSTWTNKGGFVELRSFGGSVSNQATLYIGAGTTNPFMYNWTGGSMYPSQSYVVPYIGYSQSAKIDPMNNSTGMYITGIDYTGSNVGIKAVVETGKISDYYLNMKLYFQNVEFASAYVERR